MNLLLSGYEELNNIMREDDIQAYELHETIRREMRDIIANELEEKMMNQSDK